MKTKRRATIWLLALFLIGAMLLAACTSNPTLFSLINEDRAYYGLVPLEDNVDLATHAYNHAVFMAQQGALSLSDLTPLFANPYFLCLGQGVAWGYSLPEAHYLIFQTGISLFPNWRWVGANAASGFGVTWVHEVFASPYSCTQTGDQEHSSETGSARTRIINRSDLPDGVDVSRAYRAWWWGLLKNNQAEAGHVLQGMLQDERQQADVFHRLLSGQPAVAEARMIEVSPLQLAFADQTIKMLARQFPDLGDSLLTAWQTYQTEHVIVK